jgi:MoaA/NifB/PqqE/SkfB family radical SAM enzyme
MFEVKSQGVSLGWLERLFLVLTEHCTASRCRLCDYWRIKQPRHMPVDYVRGVVVPLIERSRIFRVCMTGGEPTEHPYFSEVVSELAATDARLTLITSTVYLDRWFDAVAGQIDAYMVSLDAADDKNYRKLRGSRLFDSVVQWPAQLRATCGNKIQIAFSCVVQRGNIDLLESIYDLAAATPVNGILFRVPDVSAGAFGRSDQSAERAVNGNLPSPTQIDRLSEVIQRILAKDAGIGKLMQTEDYLNSLSERFRLFANDDISLDRSFLCAAPVSSAVIDPHGRLSSCFYLPYNDKIGCVDDLSHCSQVEWVRNCMLSGDRELLRRCSRCNQFENCKATGCQP